jgi:hypothetical protein
LLARQEEKKKKQKKKKTKKRAVEKEIFITIELGSSHVCFTQAAKLEGKGLLYRVALKTSLAF